MERANRKTNSPALDQYDWAELFAQFRDNCDQPHVANVKRILELLKAITPGAKGLPGVRGRPGMRLLTELNARVTEFQWHSLLSPSTHGVIEVLRPPFGVTGTKEWEYRAVRWLLTLFQRHGELDLVHLCEMSGERTECEGWFYGRPNKRFCSAACKQYQYDTQDEVKARRARNAEHNRVYRDNLKRQEEAAKKRVGFKGEYRLRASKTASAKRGGKATETGRTDEQAPLSEHSDSPRCL